MSKQVLHKRLLFMDFEEKRFRFYEVASHSVGYNKMSVVQKEGVVGTKGKEKEWRFEGTEDAFKVALKKAYALIYEKKNEGYLSVDKLDEAFRTPPPYYAKKKKNEPTSLVRLGIASEDFRFYRLEMLRTGHNQWHVISTHGKLGTKGRSSVHRFEGSDDTYQKARHFMEQKSHEKKGQGFIPEEQAKAILFSLASPAEQKRKTKAKENAWKKTVAFGYDCDRCQKPIDPKMFEKINQWARGEGNWDAVKEHAKKVYCLDCQFDLDVFKKKLSPQ